MKRTEIRRILRSVRGAQAEVAKRAKVNPSLVANWLRGIGISQNVAGHAEAKAREIAGTEAA